MKYIQLLSAFLLIIVLFPACRNESPRTSFRGAAPQTGEGDVFFEKSYLDMHDGYSEAVVVRSAQVKTIYISGQVGEGDGLEAQMRSALAKMKALLGREGATMFDVVKMNTYIVDYGPETLEVFRGVRKEVLGEVDMPASTLVGVQALALPEWLIEIEAVAVVPLTD